MKYVNVLDKRVDNTSEWLIAPQRVASTPRQIKMPPQNSALAAQAEGRRALGIQAFQQGQFSSVLAATKSYGVSYSTTYWRLHGRLAKGDMQTSNRKLTNTEESILVQWILSMDQRGLLPRSIAVQQMADLLLAKRSDVNSGKKLIVGKN